MTITYRPGRSPAEVADVLLEPGTRVKIAVSVRRGRRSGALFVVCPRGVALDVEVTDRILERCRALAAVPSVSPWR